MNYDHAYHAGNHADVLKHIVLGALLDALSRKTTPFFVLDTHAGQGQFSLSAEQSEKTGEAAAGIQRLHAHFADAHALPEALQRYLDATTPYLKAGQYPGSPRLTLDALRETDRLACCELQAEPARQLKALLARDARTGVHLRDGYQAINALLPPKEKRGLVLIDPPYEAQLAEFDTVLAALREGLARWPNGLFALWYPIKQRRNLLPFFRQVSLLPIKSALLIELMIRPDDSPLRMNGSGMLILNPPWQLDTAIAPVLPRLRDALQEQDGSTRLEWLVEET